VEAVERQEKRGRACPPDRTPQAEREEVKERHTGDPEERKALKSSEAVLKLWLDGEGVPLAMESDIQARFSKFLIGFRVHEHETREFQRAGGRLTVTRASKDSSGAGLGHSDESHTSTTVTLLTD
jgi:hypothetical protein